MLLRAERRFSSGVASLRAGAEQDVTKKDRIRISTVLR